SDQPVETYLARTALPIPSARADVHPAAAVAGLAAGVAGGDPPARHQPGPLALPVALPMGLLVRQQQDRSILGLGRVVLVGHPAPDDLAGIRLAVDLRAVLDDGTVRPGRGRRTGSAVAAVGTSGTAPGAGRLRSV